MSNHRATRTPSRAAMAAALLGVCALVAPVAQAAAAHPSVARIIVQEKGATAFGSGSLIDRRDQYGMVITNWHVVRDAVGKIEVVFPDGFRSEARAIKLDEDWDLAALVIWRPPTDPIPIADHAPRPGDSLTICGYGQGDYRQATGRCTEFYAPELGMPRELVELSVEARQGDSGGPILNDRGELAGVLFGASNGTTLGSFAPRVETFLASVAPDIGRRGVQPAASPTIPQTPALIAHAPPRAEPPQAKPAAALTKDTSQSDSPAWQSLAAPQALADAGTPASSPQQETGDRQAGDPWPEPPVAQDLFASSTKPESAEGADIFETWGANTGGQAPAVAAISASPTAMESQLPPEWFEMARNVLAVVGITFLFLQLVRVVS